MSAKTPPPEKQKEYVLYRAEYYIIDAKITLNNHYNTDALSTYKLIKRKEYVTQHLYNLKAKYNIGDLFFDYTLYNLK